MNVTIKIKVYPHQHPHGDRDPDRHYAPDFVVEVNGFEAANFPTHDSYQCHNRKVPEVRAEAISYAHSLNKALGEKSPIRMVKMKKKEVVKTDWVEEVEQAVT